jgi:hypothetical protein
MKKIKDEIKENMFSAAQKQVQAILLRQFSG